MSSEPRVFRENDDFPTVAGYVVKKMRIDTCDNAENKVSCYLENGESILSKMRDVSDVVSSQWLRSTSHSIENIYKMRIVPYFKSNWSPPFVCTQFGFPYRYTFVENDENDHTFQTVKKNYLRFLQQNNPDLEICDNKNKYEICLLCNNDSNKMLFQLHKTAWVHVSTHVAVSVSDMRHLLGILNDTWRICI